MQLGKYKKEKKVKIEDNNTKHTLCMHVISNQDVEGYNLFGHTKKQAKYLMAELEKNPNFSFLKVLDEDDGTIYYFLREQIKTLSFEIGEWSDEDHEEFNNCQFWLI